MRTIHKYKLKADPLYYQSITIADDGYALDVQDQNGELTLWCMTDPDKPQAPRQVYVIGTGFNLDSRNKSYVGTVQMGMLVWHVFIDYAFRMKMEK